MLIFYCFCYSSHIHHNILVSELGGSSRGLRQMGRLPQYALAIGYCGDNQTDQFAEGETEDYWVVNLRPTSKIHRDIILNINIHPIQLV